MTNHTTDSGEQPTLEPDFYRRVLEEIQDYAVVTLDLTGRVTMWNPGAVNTFGYSAAEMLGENLELIFTPEDRAAGAPEAEKQQALAEGKAADIRWHLRKDGSRFWANGIMTLLRDDAGAVEGFVKVLRDKTDLRHAVDERDELVRELRLERESLNDLNETLERRVGERTAELQALNDLLQAEIRDHKNSQERLSKLYTELKSRTDELESFSYSVSHDLRAPLRSVEGFSQALLDDYGEALDDTGCDYVHRIRAGARRMGHLIDSLLTLSRLSRGEMKSERVSLTALAERMEERFKDRDPERQATFTIEDGLVVQGDAQLLNIMMKNLLENAWKFTAKEAQAEIAFVTQMQDGERVFVVRDNGTGFEMKYADRLFAAFQRLHSAEEFEGTGIGLATVRRIIHRHGGRVWADATVGKGATFYFTLPGVEV